MNRFRKTVLRLAVSLLLAVPAVAGAVEVPLDNVSKITLPDNVAGWERTVVKQFGGGGGFGVGYRSGRGWANVFVYDNDEKDIPADVESKQLGDHFKAAAAEIVVATRKNGGRIVRTEERVVRTIGKSGTIGMLSVLVVRIDKDNASEHTYLYLAGYRGNYLKIRLTYPSTDDKELSLATVKFVEGLVKEL
jgi:hypothetical protein